MCALARGGAVIRDQIVAWLIAAVGATVERYVKRVRVNAPTIRCHCNVCAFGGTCSQLSALLALLLLS